MVLKIRNYLKGPAEEPFNTDEMEQDIRKTGHMLNVTQNSQQ